MAKAAFTVTFGTSLGDGQYVLTSGKRGGRLDALVAAAKAIGAGDASAEVVAVETEVAVADVQVLVDTATVTSMNHLRRALEAVLRDAQASGMV